ncbi:isocitrate lyase/PEP mutase family protein [Kordiimonas aquimaris]|uniref:isocitrate lyase/PEP mutase family protein n=1 Tax=Kordiimonas aquimaris TaxID=707591 RepID=UPI0021D3A672|nr:isocitrate lyase/phosphoenolpyruvate mutase family protein [Kordiimonas aquimaris]
MLTQTERARVFADLHQKGAPVILFNAWDAGSAAVIEKAGAKAIATGSWPVAAAQGFDDGENIPLDLAVENIRRITSLVDVPVSADIEGGYGVSSQEVANTASRMVEAGAIGFNFEDQVVGSSDLYDITEQASRIAAVRKAINGLCDNIFINARTDIFLKAAPDTHTAAMLDHAIERAEAYAEAGANGFFAPGLANENLIERLCSSTDLPINIIALPHVPDTKTLASLGVARISYGPVPYKRMTAWLEEEARQALSQL